MIKMEAGDRIELCLVVGGRKYNKFHVLKADHNMLEAEFLVVRMMREAYRDAELGLG